MVHAVVMDLLDTVPKPAGDVRETAVEAVGAQCAFAEFLTLLSADLTDRQEVIDPERKEPISLPPILRGKNVAMLVDIDQIEYRERC